VKPAKAAYTLGLKNDAAADANKKLACDAYVYCAKRIIEAQAEDAELSQVNVAKFFGVNKSTISRLLLWHQNGCDERGPFAQEAAVRRARKAAAKEAAAVAARRNDQMELPNLPGPTPPLQAAPEVEATKTEPGMLPQDVVANTEAIMRATGMLPKDAQADDGVRIIVGPFKLAVRKLVTGLWNLDVKKLEHPDLELMNSTLEQTLVVVRRELKARDAAEPVVDTSLQERQREAAAFAVAMGMDGTAQETAPRDVEEQFAQQFSEHSPATLGAS
jgi:hypothetical protein